MVGGRLSQEEATRLLAKIGCRSKPIENKFSLIGYWQRKGSMSSIALLDFSLRLEFDHYAQSQLGILR